LTLDELQQLIDRMYSRKDQARGVEGTFMWLMEEVGELAAALRESSKEDIAKEFADVLAWLATIANVAGINLTEAIRMKYGHGCPGCGQMAGGGSMRGQRQNQRVVERNRGLRQVPQSFVSRITSPVVT